MVLCKPFTPTASPARSERPIRADHPNSDAAVSQLSALDSVNLLSVAAAQQALSTLGQPFVHEAPMYRVADVWIDVIISSSHVLFTLPVGAYISL